MDDKVIQFQCPHCDVQHQVPIEFAGNRQPCSACGKPMRLPTYIAKNDPAVQKDSVHQNVAGSVVLACPVCQNQLYATADQIGQDVLCENCLESVTVTAPQETPPAPTNPDPAVDDTNPIRVRSAPLPSPSKTVAPDQFSEESEPLPEEEEEEEEEEVVDLEPIEDAELYQSTSAPVLQPTGQPQPAPSTDDQYELVVEWTMVCQSCQIHLIGTPLDVGSTLQCPDCGEPVTVAAPEPMPTPTRRLIDPSVTLTSTASGTRIAIKSAQQPEPAKPEPEIEMIIQWSVVCPVCQSSVEATPDDIGSTKECPDCFKPLPIHRPETMPSPVPRRKLIPEVDEQAAFDLSATPPLREKIDRDATAVSNMFLNQAKEKHDETIAVEEALADISWLKMLLMIGTNVTLLSRVGMLLLAWIVNASIFHLTRSIGDHPATPYMVAIILIFAIGVFMVISLFAFTTLINIVRQTAYGDLKITQWPTFDAVDWAIESLSLYVALGVAATPAALVYVLISAITGDALPFLAPSMAVLITAALLPFTMLSLFENNRLYLPYSKKLHKQMTTYPELVVKLVIMSSPVLGLSVLTFPILMLSNHFAAIAFSVGILWISLVIYTRNIGIFALVLARETDQ